MNPATPYSAHQPAPARSYHCITLSSPWSHEASTDFSAWLPASNPLRRQEHPNLTDRCVVQLQSGPFSCSLRPNSGELRSMAHAMTCLADELEMAAAGLTPGQADAELTHAVAAMVHGAGQ